MNSILEKEGMIFMNNFREIYNYREMLFSLVRRELRGRYKGSVLGFLWTFINPLLQMLVYTVVFSAILKSGIDKYYLFLFVVLIPWIFFSTSVIGSASCVVAQKSLITKIYFPREILPLSYVTTCFVNMLLSFIVVFIIIFISGVGFNIHALLYLPIVMIIEFFLTLGLSMLVAGITVYLRDIEHILNIVMMAWQFLTPIMYSVDVVPEKYKGLFQINPMTSIMIAYRDILYYKKLPQLNTLFMAVLFGAIVLVLGYVSFSKLKKGFAEEL